MPKRPYVRAAAVRALHRKGLPPDAIAAQLNVRVSHVTRILNRSPLRGKGLARAKGLSPTEQSALQRFLTKLKQKRANQLTQT